MYFTQFGKGSSEEKKCNKFRLHNLLWECLSHSKMQKTKTFPGPFWRASGTQAEKYAKSGQNGLCALPSIFKMAQGFFFVFYNFESLKHPHNKL